MLLHKLVSKNLGKPKADWDEPELRTCTKWDQVKRLKGQTETFTKSEVDQSDVSTVDSILLSYALKLVSEADVAKALFNFLYLIYSLYFYSDR